MIDLVLDTRQFDHSLTRFGDAVLDGTKPLSQLDAAVKADIGREWTNNGKARGGTVRGEDWAGFADQYTREDGTVIPAWGGVAKVRGRGNVKGKLRPSGKRVTEQSIIGQDTGRFRRALLASKPHITGKNTLTIGGESLPDYAEHVNALRSVVHWAPKDQGTFTRIAEAYLDGLAREANK